MLEWIFFATVGSAVLYILMPLYAQNKSSFLLLPEDQTFSYLKEKKAAVYSNLRDLDFDYSIGKIAQQDYDRIRSEFKEEAAEILTQMDELDRWIDKEIAIRRPGCPVCSEILPKNAKFCPKCGAKI